MLSQAGVCGHENDHDDARMVGLRWSDYLSLCWENRGRRHDTGPLGKSSLGLHTVTFPHALLGTWGVVNWVCCSSRRRVLAPCNWS